MGTKKFLSEIKKNTPELLSSVTDSDGPARPFTLEDGFNKESPLYKSVMKDFSGMSSPLMLMRYYLDRFEKSTTGTAEFKKLDWLFQNGKTPEKLDGYYHGITVGLKSGFSVTSTLDKIRRELGIEHGFDPIEVFTSRVLSKIMPWAGKNFEKINKKKVKEFTDGAGAVDGTTYLGINSFRREKGGVLNNIAGELLSIVIEMEGVPGADKKPHSWIYSKGGLFVANKQKSVDVNHPDKEVIALNYRWNALGNRLPIKLLIDELVEIADGLFLGKLYFSTAKLGSYDPQTISEKDYKYRNFGFFLLMDDTWLTEKNTLFPWLCYKLSDELSTKFTTYRSSDPAKGKKLQTRISKHKSVLHYLQAISDGVKEQTKSEEKFIAKLDELFAAGERPDGIEGFLHGGVVTFNRGGFFKKFQRNVLNDLYPAIRPFSPWSGKTFKKSSVAEIKKYIGKDAKYLEGEDPLYICANTFRSDPLKALPTLFIDHLDAIGMVVEKPTKKEKEQGICVKSFYFTSIFDKSVMEATKGTEVLGFNYRWRKFHTMPPDCLCRDELVRIADGLYLGQLLYSTKPEVTYDPEKPQSVYKYENFGYFLLMDDDWHAIKEFIEFDTE